MTTLIKLPVPAAEAAPGIESEAGSRWLTAARISLVGMLMAAPLAYGAVVPWAWGTMCVLSLAPLLLWTMHCVRRGSVRVRLSPLYVPILAVLALAGVQLLAGWTLDAIGTREAIIKLTCYLLVFFLAQQLFTGAPTRVWRRLGGAVIIYGFAMALFAMIQFFSSPGLLYWAIRPRWGGWVFGPYVSHNNYAGLMELLIPVAVALVAMLPERHAARPFAVFAVLICVLSVLLSGSRGGVISLVVEFGILALAMLVARPSAQRRNRVVVLGLALAIAAGAGFFWLDPGNLWKRWEDMANSPDVVADARATFAADTLRMARAHLGRGVGLGAFETGYTPYQTMATDILIDYAHNDYVQFVAETGIVGWVLIPVSLAAFFWLAFRRLRHRLGHARGWLQLGAAVGVCGILAHSFVDFNLHIPANAAWFAACAGWATVWREHAKSKAHATLTVQ